MEINQDTGARPARGGAPVSRRWLLGASAGALLAVGCTKENLGGQAYLGKETRG